MTELPAVSSACNGKCTSGRPCRAAARFTAGGRLFCRRHFPGSKQDILGQQSAARYAVTRNLEVKTMERIASEMPEMREQIVEEMEYADNPTAIFQIQLKHALKRFMESVPVSQ